MDNLQALEARHIDGYVPDSNLARYLNRGGVLRTRASAAAHRRMRRKLRDPAGRAMYARRKAIVEPVHGVLKEQRGMRRFRQRGLAKVAGEWALATTAYNLTRLWRASTPPNNQSFVASCVAKLCRQQLFPQRAAQNYRTLES